jgi:hypothetical protein
VEVAGIWINSEACGYRCGDKNNHRIRLLKEFSTFFSKSTIIGKSTELGIYFFASYPNLLNDPLSSGPHFL